MSSNKVCEICKAFAGYCSVHFDITCPVDNCTNTIDMRNHTICEKCLNDNQYQVKFDEVKANKNIKRIAKIRKEHNKAFNKLKNGYLI
jgi:hypothetical protein